MDWLAEEIERLGVDVRFRQEIVLDGLSTIGPVVSSWELPSGPVPTSWRQVVLVDDVGHMEAMGVAQHVAAGGCDLTVVSRFAEMASQIKPAWATWSGREHLARAGVRLLPRTFISAIGDGVVCISSLDGGSDVEVESDVVVHVSFHQPNLRLADALGAIAADIHVIGEARTRRFLTASIRDGYEVGRAL